MNSGHLVWLTNLHLNRDFSTGLLTQRSEFCGESRSFGGQVLSRRVSAFLRSPPQGPPVLWGAARSEVCDIIQWWCPWWTFQGGKRSPFGGPLVKSREIVAVVVVHGLSCSDACGIYPHQESNLCLLHWQIGSLPLSHQGSPEKSVFWGFFKAWWRAALH